MVATALVVTAFLRGYLNRFATLGRLVIVLAVQSVFLHNAVSASSAGGVCFTLGVSFS